MDLESLTTPLQEGKKPRLAGDLRSDSGFPLGVQRIAVIGHVDAVEGEEDCRYYRVRDSPSGVNETTADYLDFIIGRQRAAARKKRALLAPLLRVTQASKDAHLAAFASCSSSAAPPRRRAEESRGWNSTIFGRFHERLEALVRRYVIFSFNGVSYDHPLLAPPLCLAAKSRRDGCQVSLNKRGNGVVSMTLKGAGSGIVFRDIREMLDRSFSLQRFAEMCELKKEKELFPFRQIARMKDLDKKEFQWDAESWRNDLTGEETPADKIEDVRRSFREGKFPNVYMYLLQYLEADLLLLRRGCSKLFDMFHDVMGFHALDAGKFTISSASWYAGQLHLFRHKRPATYNVQVPAAYAMLQKGTLGGVTLCARAACDPEDDSPSAAINSHLLSAAGADFQLGGDAEVREHERKLFCTSAPPSYECPAVEDVLERVAGVPTSQPLPCDRAGRTPSRRMSLANFLTGSLEAVVAAADREDRPPLEALRSRRLGGGETGRRLFYTDVVGLYANSS